MIKLSINPLFQIYKIYIYGTKTKAIVIIKKANSEEEIFQNEILRPILKLQHDLVITLAQEFLKSRNITWEKVKEKDPFQWLNINIKRDIPFKNQLIGMVIGQFSKNELDEYLTFQKEMNKRIINMMTERIVSHYVRPINKF